MPTAKPQIVVCTYRVRKGKDAAFRKLIRKHWATLNRLGLVAKEPRLVMRGLDRDNLGDLIEIFAWKPGGFERAHKLPDVLAIWEPMEMLCESRGGRPSMEFPHYERLPA
ncbi:MAG TPA: hypothetical protein VEU51_10815 [Candidatus Acidoferrales bacterium]|nr:hypothetical protein [Candidatus Acidoferrales bacterium]